MRNLKEPMLSRCGGCVSDEVFFGTRVLYRESLDSLGYRVAASVHSRSKSDQLGAADSDDIYGSFVGSTLQARNNPKVAWLPCGNVTKN
jgi:hypothetical protein